MWGAGQDAGSEACQEGFNEEVTFEFGTEGGNWGAVGEGTGQGLGRGHRLCKGPGAGLCGWSRVSEGGEKAEVGTRGETCRAHVPAFNPASCPHPWGGYYVPQTGN